MDPLSIIASTIAIVQATVSICKAIQNLRGLPKEFNEVSRRLPLAEDTLRLVRNQLEGQTLDEPSKTALGPCVSGCEAKAKKLRDIFKNVENGLAKDGSVLEFYRASLLRLGKPHRVETLMKDMLRDLDSLVTNQLFRAAPQSLLTRLKEAIDQLAAVVSSVPDSDLDSSRSFNQTIRAGGTGYLAETQYNKPGSGSNWRHQFPVQTPPICPDPRCNKSAIIGISHSRGSYGRPYYYCQNGHEREFIFWDDDIGIEQGNPICKCGHLSRREQQAGPIRKAQYRCATRECNLWRDILDDDGPDDRSSASPEARSGRQSTPIMPSPPRYQHGPGDTPTKYLVQGVVAMTQPNLASELGSLSLSNSIPRVSQKIVSDKCPIHGLGNGRLFRRNRCECSVNPSALGPNVCEQLADMLFGSEEMRRLYEVAVTKLDVETFLKKHDIMLRRYLRDLRRSTDNELFLAAINALDFTPQRHGVTELIGRQARLTATDRNLVKTIQAEKDEREYRPDLHLIGTAQHAESEYRRFPGRTDGQAVDSDSDGKDTEVLEEGNGGLYEFPLINLNLDVAFFLNGSQFQTLKARMQYLAHPPADISEALAFDDANVLTVLLQKRFKYVARDDYSWLTDLNDVGYTYSEIAELLYERAHDSPWIYFKPTGIPPGQIQCDHHLDRCAHRLLSTSYRDDRLVGWPDSKADQEIEIRRSVEELCGLGGISPSSRNTSDWNGTVQFEEGNSVASLSHSSASPSLNNTEDIVSRLIRVAEGFATAARLVQHASFCCDSFTILRHSSVEDDGASPQVQLVRLSFSWAVRVLELLKILGKQHKDGEDFQPALRDLQKASEKITGPIFFHRSLDSNNELLQRTLQAASLAIQYLCVGFLSYSQAHIGHIQPFFLDIPLQKLQLLGLNTAATSDVHLTASLVKLTCLGGMTQGPVLVFDVSTTIDYSPSVQQPGRFDVCASPEDVLDTWGPGQLIFKPGSFGSPLAIKIGGGYISPPPSGDSTGKYHWDSVLRLAATAPSLEFGANIVIASFIQINSNCQIDEGQCWLASSWKLEELGTFQSYYDLIEKQVGIQGGPDHVAFRGNLVWAKMPGQTIKKKRLGEPNGTLIAFLDCCWGVKVSFCTGIAQRVRLRDLVADVLPAFAETFTTQTEKDQCDRLKSTYDIIAVFKSKGIDPQSIPDWLRSLPDPLSEFVCYLVRWILATLADTGLSPNGQYFSVGWPWNGKINRCFRIPLDSYSKWVLMMADSDDCATFAYITQDCLQTGTKVCRGPNPSWQNHIYQLETSVLCPASPGPGLWTVCRDTTYFFRKLDNDLVWVKATVADNIAAPATLVRLTSIKSLPRDVRQRLLLKEGWRMQKRLKEKDDWSVTAEIVSILSQTPLVTEKVEPRPK